MENGVGVVNGSGLGEKEVVEDEILDSKVENLVVAGVDEYKNSKGHDISEATDSERPRVDFEGVNNAVKEEEYIEKKGILGDSLELDGSLDVGDEAENHKEQDPLTFVHEKMEGMVEDKDAVTLPAISDEQNVSGVLIDEVLLANDQQVDNIKDEVKEVSDLGVADEVVLNDELNVDEKTEVVLEESRNRNLVIDNVNLDVPEAGENKDGGVDGQLEPHSHENLENTVANDLEGGEPDSRWQVKESNGKILHQIDKNIELKDTSGIFDTGHQHDKNWELEFASDGLHSDKVEALPFSCAADEKLLEDGVAVNEETGVVFDKTCGIFDAGHQDEKSEDLEDNKQETPLHIGSRDSSELDIGEPVSQSLDIQKNGEMLDQIGKNVEMDESCSISDDGHQDEKNGELEDKKQESPLHIENRDANELDVSEPVSRTQDIQTNGEMLHHIDKNVESNKICGIFDAGHQNGKNEELDDVSAGVCSDKKAGKAEELVDKLINFDRVLREDSKRELKEETTDTTMKESTVTLEASRLPSSEDKTKSFASNVLPENPFTAQFERPTTKNEEVKESIVGARESEIKRSTDVPSSTESPAPTITSAPAARPAGLGRAAPLLEPSPRVVQQPRVNGTVSQMQNQLIEESTNGEAEENDETREKLQMIRVKFLRLAHRLGQTPHNVVVAQVLYRLGLAEQLRGGTGGRVAAFSFDRASAMAEQLEAGGQEPLDFSCTIMVLGKTGVGKSATINSIFDQVKFGTDAFQLGTKKVQDVVGTVQGIKVRIIDTPGLLPSLSDQRRNEKILHSVKQYIKKSPPDIVLYLDRLDMQSRDSGDMPLLRTITDTFGPSIWFNAIVVLTHAASAPPEGPNGVATGYDMFVTQRSHVVQQAIRQAAGDMRLMNPVSLVENHSACRTNRAGQRVLPNGQVWKPHLLLLSFASKILTEANLLLKLQDGPPGKPFVGRVRAPPLPFLLSSLLQSRPQPKLPHEQFGDDDDTLDQDLDESTDSDDDSEYDELPPFKRLTRAQLSKLTKAQKKAYYDELELREKLFMKKQLKEEKRRRRLMKKMSASANELPNDFSESVEEESSAASVPVAMPDLSLPASFGSDNPTHRYRYLDSSNQWLVRPVLDTHGWDHDVGYEGVNVERLFVVKDKVPVSFSGQITKDKKDANIQMEVAGSVKHGEGKATTLGFDMQQIGKDIAYTIRSDTRFSNFRRNKATAGLSATHFSDSLIGGVKVEDKLIVGRRGQVVISGGAIIGRGDVAYGGSLEATLRDKDYPLGRFLTTMGLSVMDWHGDLAIGWNAQSQIPIGRYTNLIGRVNFNNRGQGQISIKLNSSEQLQIALVSLVPLLRKVLGYSQPTQFGY